ncbi:hypothetical protein GIB67_000820 [Kingdonia uniflora]|uniref:Beta-glucosidase n=1 Tax=Kingdonia uniflora TaxID=39325 RepID=A0A7J7P0K6_9MAGN|nr:hypothetical protein GIB67_000820 [Kingdonia uniflora]
MATQFVKASLTVHCEQLCTSTTTLSCSCSSSFSVPGKDGKTIQLHQVPLLLLLLVVASAMEYNNNDIIATTSTFSRNDFPPDVFGAGSSAYQIEGAASEDGRKPSIWDTFTHAEKIADKSNADIGSDQYHKYKNDVKLMQDMGLDAYRMSISWSRLIPDFIGLNHYQVFYVSDIARSLDDNSRDYMLDISARIGGLPTIRVQKNTKEFLDFSRLKGPPELPLAQWGLQRLLEYVRVNYKNPAIEITENGFPLLTSTGRNDTKRVEYLQVYIESLLTSIWMGSNLRGYFVWSSWTASSFCLDTLLSTVSMKSTSMTRIGKGTPNFQLSGTLLSLQNMERKESRLAIKYNE